MAFRNPLTINPLTSIPASGIVGLIQGSQLAADSINGKTITGGTINGETINGGIITGALIQTAASGQRWELGTSRPGNYGTAYNTLFGYTNSGYESDPAVVEVGQKSGFVGVLELLLRAPTAGGHAAAIRIATDYFSGTDTIYLQGQVSAPSKLQAGTAYLPGIGANGGFVTVDVYFGAYFPTPPVVTLSTSSGRLTTSISVAASTSGFTAGINNWTSNNSSAGTLYWTAVAA